MYLWKNDDNMNCAPIGLIESRRSSKMGRLAMLLAVLLLASIDYGHSQGAEAQEEDVSRRRSFPKNQVYPVAGASASASASADASAGQILPYSCYTCSSCPQINDFTPTKHCPNNFMDPEKNKCVFYSVYYKIPNVNKTSWVTRGCATERGSCTEIRSMGSPTRVVEWCEECSGDLCNGKSGAPAMAAALALLAAPLLMASLLV